MSENKSKMSEKILTNVAFLTLGCKVNAYETDAMEKKFHNAGYNVVTIEENFPIDIFVINTCTVTNMADRKSRQAINRVRKNNPDAIIVATGCYVQAEGDKIMESKVVDIAVGNNKKQDIVDIVEQYMHNHSLNKAIIDINDKQCEYEEMSIDKTMENTRAYVKIQDGCNQFCSYCIIPYARGRIRSRKIEDIISEIDVLAQNGYKEVVITGIHLSSYGMDFEHVDTFNSRDYNPFMFKYLIEVIKKVNDIQGIERIRLGSLEPRIITDEFLEDLSSIEKLCPHFHLSLQSGCDETLKRMNRKYDTQIYMNGLNLLRKYFDNPAITTDVIVGFVGETEQEAKVTYEFLEKCNFSMMHIFKYSRRKGTAADRMTGHIKDELKNERSARLLELTKKQHLEYMKSFIGTKQKVLLEEVVKIDDKEYFIGHNERYVKIAVEVCENMKSNEIIEITIEKILKDDMLFAR